MIRPALTQLAAFALSASLSAPLFGAPLLPRQGLEEAQKLLPPGGGVPGAGFGHAVALDAATYAVGAPFAPNDGRVMLFTRTATGELDYEATVFPQGGQCGGVFRAGRGGVRRRARRRCGL